ncbi:hypothetical protein H8S95_11475 [Pontibacter sp. KCTC 32443]|uniref:hypothetical protein n=1 Tax=Pontibacter TaxID=323449 RepID=UPI00164E81D7|nr:MULTISPECIES: hypothetical protein [Pontibacter]MBC5774684.1 hypothetical protein [Pontibacter sp. KCTC 32443]
MKKLFTLILLACTITAFAQDFQPGKLIFANGKEMTGLVKTSSVQEENVVFKATDSAAKEKINRAELSKVTFPQKDSDAVVYVPVHTVTYGRKSKEPYWLQVLIEGPVTLYGHGATMSFNRGGMPHNVSDVTFYAKRTDEKEATWVGMHFTSGAMGVNVQNTFRKQSALYFADYPELVTRIENKEFKVTDLPVIVTEYNKWKSAKK